MSFQGKRVARDDEEEDGLWLRPLVPCFSDVGDDDTDSSCDSEEEMWAHNFGSCADKPDESEVGDYSVLLDEGVGLSDDDSVPCVRMTRSRAKRAKSQASSRARTKRYRTSTSSSSARKVVERVRLCRSKKKLAKQARRQAAALKRKARLERDREARARKKAAGFVPWDVTTEEFEKKLLPWIDAHPDQFFKDSQQSLIKSLLLFYLNSGYALYDQWKEYDENYKDKPVDIKKVVSDVKGEAITDEQLCNIVETYYKDHSYVDGDLISCACCGSRLQERNGTYYIS